MTFPVESPHLRIQKTQYAIKTISVSYEVSSSYRKFNLLNHTTKKQILKDVNCEVKPTAITAVAGPSGAEKTTLLEILAGVIHPRKVTGQVVVNNRPMNPTAFRQVSGYIPQEDLLFPLLTVEETLLYSARLRLEGGLANAKRRVSELLLKLGLSHVAGERISGFNRTRRGISSGEKRRVSIGVDLVHDPEVLLMDEPTSGLDSASALQLMSMLKILAKDHQKTIVLTIHQPGFRILELFDQLVLLVDGTVVHNGSLDQLDHRLKLAGHCIPQHVNVLEFSIEMIKTLITTDLELEYGFDLVDEQLLDARVRPDRYHQFRYANSPLVEMVILSERFCYNIFRTKDLVMSKMAQSVVVGILLGTTFKNVNRFGIQTQFGFFAFNLSFLIYSSSEALPIFLEERKILLKETSIGAYRLSSYTLANTLVFVPFLLIVALLYAVPTYWLVGLRDDIDGFVYFSLVVWLVLLMSNSFVVCFSSLVSSFMVGITLVEGLMGSFFLFSGYFISKNDIPKYWIWVHYLSLVKYPFESFLINEFGVKEED